MEKLHNLTLPLMWAGALNWGLVGAFKFNLVMFLLGSWPKAEMLVYILIGLSAVYEGFMHKKICRLCAEGRMM